MVSDRCLCSRLGLNSADYCVVFWCTQDRTPTFLKNSLFSVHNRDENKDSAFYPHGRNQPLGLVEHQLSYLIAFQNQKIK